MKSFKNKGLTVLEMLFVCALVGLITSLIFASYRLGLTATFKSLSQSELFGQMQLAIRILGNDMRQASEKSVTLAADGKGLSFLSCYDANGAPVLDPESRPSWQAFLVFYHDPTNKTLVKRRLALSLPSPLSRYPLPIEEYDPGGGLQPQAFYFNSGQQVARMVEEFSVSAHPSSARTYLISLKGLKPREGVNAESYSALRTVIFISN